MVSQSSSSNFVCLFRKVIRMFKSLRLEKLRDTNDFITEKSYNTLHTSITAASFSDDSDREMRLLDILFGLKNRNISELNSSTAIH